MKFNTSKIKIPQTLCTPTKRNLTKSKIEEPTDLHEFNQEEQLPKTKKHEDKCSSLGFLTTGNPYSMKRQQEFDMDC